MEARRRLRAVLEHLPAATATPAPEAGLQREQPAPAPAAEGFVPGESHGFIPYSVTEADRRQLAEQGFLLLPRILEPQALSALQEDVQSHWDRVKAGHDNSEGTWLQAGLLPNIHHLSSRARDVYWRGPVVSACRELIGPNVKAATSQLTFKMPGMVQGVDAHFDNGYGHLQPYSTLSTLLALDDVELDNGPVCLFPGSHLAGQRPLDDGGEYQSSASNGAKVEGENFKEEAGARVIKMDTGNEEGVPMLMKAGQVLIMHCHMCAPRQPAFRSCPHPG